MVRCKFKVHYKEDVKNSATGEITSTLVKMSPVYGESEENKNFFKYTPGGEFNVYSMNPIASAQLEIGKEYYIDISPAE